MKTYLAIKAWNAFDIFGKEKFYEHRSWPIPEGYLNTPIYIVATGLEESFVLGVVRFVSCEKIQSVYSWGLEVIESYGEDDEEKGYFLERKKGRLRFWRE
jgi:hypothetical protein